MARPRICSVGNDSLDMQGNRANGAPTAPFTVTTADSTLTSNYPFNVTPQLLSFSPPFGLVGQSVTITGTGLAQTLRVNFGDVKATNLDVLSDTQVTAAVPVGAKTSHIVIETQGGIAVSPKVFTVTQ